MVAQEGLSVRTAYLYSTKIGRFAQDFGDIEKFSPKAVAVAVTNRAQTASDHNSWVCAINKYQQYCRFVGSEAVFVGELKVRRGAERLPKPLSEEEINGICEQVNIASSSGKRDRAIIELLYCGLRNQEACDVSLENLDVGTVLVHGKGAKERYVPINDVAWYFLADYIILQLGTSLELEMAGKYGLDFAFAKIKERLQNERIPVFLTTEGNKMYPRAVRKMVYRYATLANIANVHPHRFRHSFATHTLDSGLGNLTALKDVLGHTDFNMVQRYVLTTKVGRERVKSFHPRQRRGHIDTNDS
jgi:site-specific recombinase XerD